MEPSAEHDRINNKSIRFELVSSKIASNEDSWIQEMVTFNASLSLFLFPLLVFWWCDSKDSLAR